MSAVIKYSPVTPSDFDRLIVYRDSALLALTQTAIVVLGDPYCARYQVPGTRYQVPGTRYQVPGTRYQVDSSPCSLLQGQLFYALPALSAFIL